MVVMIPLKHQESLSELKDNVKGEAMNRGEKMNTGDINLITNKPMSDKKIEKLEELNKLQSATIQALKQNKWVQADLLELSIEALINELQAIDSEEDINTRKDLING
jgi:hypothetical protein